MMTPNFSPPAPAEELAGLVPADLDTETRPEWLVLREEDCLRREHGAGIDTPMLGRAWLILNFLGYLHTHTVRSEMKLSVRLPQAGEKRVLGQN